MKKIVSLFVMSVCVWGMAGLSAAQDEIVIAGSGDSQALLRILAQAFEKANPGAKINVPDSIGTSGGIKAAIEGRCDLGRVARGLKEKEAQDNLNYMVFAYSPVVFAVNPDLQGVDSLTPEQLVGVFSGAIVSWSEVGGKEGKIYIVQREEGDSSRLILEGNLPGWKGIQAFAGQTVYSSPEVPVLIRRYKGTIGYAALSIAKEAGLTVLKVSGAYPSAENIKNGSYKLITPFGLVWKGELKGLARAFVDFIMSPEGQKIIAEHGAVPFQ